MDPVGNDTDKWIIIRPSGKMSFFSTQVANISDAREYGFSGGEWVVSQRNEASPLGNLQ